MSISQQTTAGLMPPEEINNTEGRDLQDTFRVKQHTSTPTGMDRTTDNGVLYKDSANTCLGEEPQESQRMVPLPVIKSSIHEIHDTEDPTACLNTTQDTPGDQQNKPEHGCALRT